MADGDSEEEEDGGDDAGDLPANSNAETVAKVYIAFRSTSIVNLLD